MESRFCIITRWTRKAGNKLTGKRGVSLVEMLLCVLILLLSTGVTVSTLDLGIRHFQSRTRETEQRLLCDTLSLAVQEYLTYVYDYKWDEDELSGFKTGAVGALYDIPCQFVTRFYNDEGKFVSSTNTESDPGEIAIQYTQSGERKFYALADQSLYIKKRTSTTPGVHLEATLNIKTDRTNKRFEVTITVHNKDGGTGDAENTFIVIPVNQGVIPD